MSLKHLVASLLLSTCILISVRAELKFVLEMFRHGARGPINPQLYSSGWGNDFWSNFGELTEIGMRQHYLLGQEVRKRYIEKEKLLPPKMDPSLIYVRSTDINRTIVSALSHLYGLYPLGQGHELPKGYPQERAVPPQDLGFEPYKGDAPIPEYFQPVPVHMAEFQYEYLLRSFDKDICPAQRKNLAKTMAGSNIKRLSEVVYKPTTDALRKAVEEAGYKVERWDLEIAFRTTDNLICDYYAGRKLPTIEYNTELWKNLTLLWDTLNTLLKYETAQQRRLVRTPIFQDFAHIFKSKAEGKLPFKMYIYSAHDTTLLNVLGSLNITTWECLAERSEKAIYEDTPTCPHGPKFASSMFFELHQDDQGWFVKVIYDDVPYKVCVNGTAERCELDEFINGVLLKDLDPDWMKHCEIPGTQDDFVKKAKNNWKIFVIALLAVIGLLTLGCIVRYVVKIKKLGEEEGYRRV